MLLNVNTPCNGTGQNRVTHDGMTQHMKYAHISSMLHVYELSNNSHFCISCRCTVPKKSIGLSDSEPEETGFKYLDS